MATGQRPVIFSSNGYGHWLWDDTQAAPQSVQGFRTKDELALLIQRRSATVPMASLVGRRGLVRR